MFFNSKLTINFIKFLFFLPQHSNVAFLFVCFLSKSTISIVQYCILQDQTDSKYFVR